MALSTRSIHRLLTWPHPRPLAHPSQLPSLLLKRSSQTFARSGNSLSPHPNPLKPLSRLPPRLPFHRSYNANSYHVHHYPSFWARNKAILITSGVTGLCLGTYYLQWTAESNFDLSRFIERNLINSPENINEGRWWVLVSSSIAHANLLHLLVNAIAMWGFIPTTVTLFNVPLFIGGWLFTAASCSAASTYWQAQKHILLHDYNHRPWPKKGEDYTILGLRISRDRAAAICSDAQLRYGGSVGASGAICGLTGMLLCYLPRLPIRLFFVLPMPLWLGELAFALGSGYCMATGYVPSVGHAGHLGGTAAGIAYYYALVRPWLRRVGRL